MAWSNNNAINMRLCLQDLAEAQAFLARTQNPHSYDACLAEIVVRQSLGDAIGFASKK